MDGELFVKTKMKSGEKKYVSYLLSFLIPMIVVVLAYLNQGIYPGSTNTILIYDMRAQLLALYGYLSERGPGFDNLFYSMSGALGGGFYGTLALYISPTDLIYSLIPVRYLPDAVYLMTVIKVSLCGLTCSIFLRNDKSLELSNLMTVTLSSCYSLMTYNFMYAMSPMWLDAVMLLPLLALMLEKIINGEKSIGFVLLMSLCIISDYYMAYMCVLALILYFIFRVIENGEGFKSSIKKLILFALHGIISAGISAFVIVPVVIDFSRGKIAENGSRAINHVFVKNSLWDVIESFAPQSYATLDYTASPNIFCGSIVLALVMIWLCGGRKKIHARLASLSVIAIFFISFIFGPVDRIWHGFRDPVGFSVRYAFAFAFFMICFAARGYRTLKSYSAEKYKSILSLIGAVFIFYTFIELYINGGYILSRLAVEQRFANRDEYNKICDVMAELVPGDIYEPSGYGRIARNFNFSRIDGALYGYDGFDRFSSSYNYTLDELFNKLGIGASYHTVTENGLNPATAALFDIKYYLSYYRDATELYDFLEEYRLYKLYENRYCLPLAFAIDASVPESCEDLGDDPFKNINIVYKDLYGDYGDSDIFQKIDFIRTDRDSSDFYKDDTVDSVDFTFTTTKDGDYYFYSADTEPVPGYEGTWADGYFSSRRLFADSYIDGIENYTYRTDEFSYITSSGHLSGNETHVLTLDSSLAEVGDTWIYYFNESVFRKISETINDKGFKIEYIGPKGIKLAGNVADDGYVLISIPYEDGYEVLVDGVSTDYTSYRDSLLLIPVETGEHELMIKYFPPGLSLGMVVSFISLCLSIIYTKGLLILKPPIKRNNAQKNIN